MATEKGLRIACRQCTHPARKSAVSSGVEHHIDIVGVTGSNPVSRTIFLPLSRYVIRDGGGLLALDDTAEQPDLPDLLIIWRTSVGNIPNPQAWFLAARAY